jgi:hypothetical protein
MKLTCLYLRFRPAILVQHILYLTPVTKGAC